MIVACAVLPLAEIVIVWPHIESWYCFAGGTLHLARGSTAILSSRSTHDLVQSNGLEPLVSEEQHWVK